MSILQDLDPKNAKIDPQTPNGNTRKFAWMLALISFLGGSAWLVFNFQFEKNTVASDRVAALKPSSNDSPMAPVTAKVEPQPQVPPAAPVTAAPGSAQIHESSATQNEHKEDSAPQGGAFQAMRQEVATPRNHQVAHEKGSPKGHKLVKSSQEKKAASKISAKKSPKKTATKTTTNTHTAKYEKKPAERDIDIISAIVK